MSNKANNTEVKKDTLIAKFFGAFATFDSLKVETAIGVMKHIVNNTGRGYFEKIDTITDGKDKLLKKYFTETLELFFGEQATACRSEILSLPDDIWIGEPAKANVQVFEVTQSSSGTLSLKAGSTFKMVRSVFMHIAQTENRLAAFDWVNLEMADAKERLYSVRDEIAEANQAAKLEAETKAEAESAEGTDDTPDGDGVDLLADIDTVIADSILELTTVCGEATLNKTQQAAVARLINEVTNHVVSLGTNSDAPKVATKESTAKTATA